MSLNRKQVPLRFPEMLIEAIDKVCNMQQISRTSFIEQACRDKLNSLKIKLVENKRLVYGVDWEL